MTLQVGGGRCSFPMKDGAPAITRATDDCHISRVAEYSDLRCVVKPRFHRTRPVSQPPSGSVLRGPLSRPEQVPSGRQTPGKDRTGLSGAGRQSERRSTDHRSRCGAEQPGPAVRRGDATAIYDQCERRFSPRTNLVRCRPFTRPLLHLGSRGEWLAIRAIGKHTMTSPSDSDSFKH